MTIEQLRGLNAPHTGPYDTLRDYLAALDARGRLLHLKEMDQDQYEATAFAYRLIDEYGWDKAPAFVIERIKIDGEWRDGPIFGNIYGGWDTEAMGLGVETVTDDFLAMYKAAVDKLVALADENGNWPRLKPVEVDGSGAPCKETIIRGGDVDIAAYPWLKVNPADGNRYINAGSMIFEDPKLGRNVGTYRCMLKTKTKIAINPEVGQHGWNFLMAAARRGQTSVKAAIVLGVDPLTWCMSSSKVAGLGEDEFELAGGFKGKPIEVVKCETSDIVVPANAEMVIEGEVPLGEQEEEGPHAEMFGYLGLKHERNFVMNIEAITHRRRPIYVNNYTGVMRGFFTAPPEAFAFLTYRKLIHNLVGIHSPAGWTGMTFVKIDKRMPTEGLIAGQIVAAHSRFGKMTVVVDKDVDIHNHTEAIHALVTRWQPDPASLIIPRSRGPLLDPSCPRRGYTSKIVIDATRQLPEEGGPEEFAPYSRTLLKELAPDAKRLVDGKWDEYWKDFKKT